MHRSVHKVQIAQLPKPSYENLGRTVQNRMGISDTNLHRQVFKDSLQHQQDLDHLACWVEAHTSHEVVVVIIDTAHTMDVHSIAVEFVVPLEMD